MHSQGKAYLYAGAVVLIWATVASAFKIGLGMMNHVQLLFLSSGSSLLILGMILAIQRKWRAVFKCRRHEYLNSIVLSALNPFLYYLVLFKAYSLLPAQQAQPLNQTWAIILSLLSIAILKQKISSRRVLAIIISFIGVWIIATRGRVLDLRFADAAGVILALSSAVIWSVFWLFNMKDQRDETVKLFLNFVFGFLLIAVFIIIFDKMPPFEPTLLLSAAYIGCFEMGLTFVLWLRALKYSKTTAQVSNMIYLVPFLSLIVIRAVLHERIYLSTFIGLIFIVGGIILQQTVRQPRPMRIQP